MSEMVKYSNITVLYVDDEDVNLFLFKANLKDKFNIITSLSPIDALKELDQKHDQIIVVISDMRMPVMNGVEFVRKAREKYSNIFYYILTGFDYNEEIDQALNEKVINKFFTKPFDATELENEILEAVNDQGQNAE